MQVRMLEMCKPVISNKFSECSKHICILKTFIMYRYRKLTNLVTGRLLWILTKYSSVRGTTETPEPMWPLRVHRTMIDALGRKLYPGFQTAKGQWSTTSSQVGQHWPGITQTPIFHMLTSVSLCSSNHFLHAPQVRKKKNKKINPACQNMSFPIVRPWKTRAPFCWNLWWQGSDTWHDNKFVSTRMLHKRLSPPIPWSLMSNWKSAVVYQLCSSQQ